MEVKIFEVVASAKFDLKNFKKVLTTNLNLDVAINDSIKNLKIAEKYVDSVREQTVIELINYQIDWQHIIRSLDESALDSFNIKIYPCKVKGFSYYTPENLNVDTSTFNFKEKATNHVDFVVVHDFAPVWQHHIEMMLAPQLIRWANDEQFDLVKNAIEK